MQPRLRMRAFHESGIFTWVSLEPTLDCDTSMAIVERTHEFVDYYKIGRLNHNAAARTTDWEDYTTRMAKLMQKLRKKHYFKKGLHAFLPDGYKNPLRIKQAF